MAGGSSFLPGQEQVQDLLGSTMAKSNRKRTAKEKRVRRERRQNFMTIFVNGKQKHIPRPPTIDGLSVDEFLARNADPMWLHQHEMWEWMTPAEPDSKTGS